MRGRGAMDGGWGDGGVKEEAEGVGCLTQPPRWREGGREGWEEGVRGWTDPLPLSPALAHLPVRIPGQPSRYTTWVASGSVVQTLAPCAVAAAVQWAGGWYPVAPFPRGQSSIRKHLIFWEEKLPTHLVPKVNIYDLQMQRSVSDVNRFAWRRTKTPRTEAPFVGLLDGDVLPHPAAGPGPGGAWGTRVPGGANGPHYLLPLRAEIRNAAGRRRRIEIPGADLWSDSNWRHLLRVITHTKRRHNYLVGRGNGYPTESVRTDGNMTEGGNC